MLLNQTFELSMLLDTEQFQRIFINKISYLKELDDEYFDTSLVAKGITIIYRDSQYKKKIRILVNAGLVVDDLSDTKKLVRKLDKRISEYFNHRYTLDQFTLSSVTLTTDINVGGRTNVSNYLKVLQRVGKVKGFSPASYDGIDENNSFCLSGNSNAIDFLLYDLEQTVVERLRDNDMGYKKIASASRDTKGILRAEVRLKKPRAIRAYTDAEDAAEQIMELLQNQQDTFLDTFTRIIPFGDFYKKDDAIEIVWREIKDIVMRRKIIRLLSLIPEKKSLHLAQKAMNCRDVERVMDAFAKINLSPVTISKRHEVKRLENLYSFLL